MGVITRRQVEHVARLARLELTEEEIDLFTTQLGDILKWVDKLQELDTTDVEPTAHTIPLRNVMRKDEVKPSWPKEEILKNASDEHNGFFRVPRILEEE